MCSRRIALALLVAQAAALVVRPSCARCRRVRLRSEPGDAPAEAAAPVEDVPIATTEPEPAAPQLTERQKEIARLRAAEKFLEKDTGKYMCKVCEYQSVRKSNSESGAPENSSRSQTRRKNLIHAQHLTSYLTGSFRRYCVCAQICGAINKPRTKAYVCSPIAKR